MVETLIKFTGRTIRV